MTFCYRSSSQLSDERGGQSSKFGGKQSGKGVLFKKRRESELAGRTCEQGEDYLIEIEGSLLYFNLFSWVISCKDGKNSRSYTINVKLQNFEFSSERKTYFVNS